MSDNTPIEWTDATWPVVAGCNRVSLGCDGCYAIRHSRRLAGNPNPKVSEPYAGTTTYRNGRLDWSGLVRPLPERLDWPLKWKKPRRIFVCNMSDLFHERVPDEFICDVFEVMEKAKQHIFQVLTKRPERMCDLITGGKFISGIGPPANIWWGVSAEDQKTLDERWTWLRQTPAAVRFVSLEPLLGPIILDDVGGGGHTALTTEIDHPEDTKLDWVIAGAESGPGARPCHPEWLRSIRDQCEASGVAFFLKQRGEFLPMPEAKARGLRWTQRTCEMASGAYYPEWMCRVGKKAAGRELDGKIWNQFPGEVTR